MSNLSGKFVWFEHVSNDIGQARRFYEPLFGWHTEAMPMGDAEPYPMILNAGVPIGGYTLAPQGAPTGWLSYLSVANVDVAYRRALDAGATSLMAPMDYGTAGRAATLADPTGAVFAIWKGSQGDPADVPSSPIGSFICNELTTQDEQAALAFYEKAFGFAHDAKPMAQGTYYVLKQGDAMRGGLCKAMHLSTPAMWAQYVKVDDCDATAAKAHALGAQSLVPPMDITGIGRFSMFSDPQGAVIAVMKPAPM